ncbi:unnamed protein product, partial [marine sediment metagenome]
DVNDLAAKIELLLSNTELRKTMGEHARESAEKISWDRVAQKTIDVYNRILSRPNLERPWVSMPGRLQKNFHGIG